MKTKLVETASLPLDKLRKKLLKNEENEFDLKECKAQIRGEKILIRRLFSSTTNEEIENTVGWVLSEDVDHCMVCSTAFSLFRTKHHCRACGNVICSSCLEEQIQIEGCEEPSLACTECYWGQEIVQRNPTYHQGLPVIAKNLFKYGPISITADAVSKFVISAKLENEERRVCINVCTTEEVPLNGLKLKPPDFPHGYVIYLVAGEFNISEDDVIVYDVFVNSHEITERSEKHLNQTDGMTELYAQIVGFIDRINMDSSNDEYEILPNLTFYSHEKTWPQNLSSTDPNSEKKRKVAIPNKQCFEKLFQVYLPFEQGETWFKEQKPQDNEIKLLNQYSSIDEEFPKHEHIKPKIKYSDSSVSKFLQHKEVSKETAVSEEKTNEQSEPEPFNLTNVYSFPSMTLSSVKEKEKQERKLLPRKTPPPMKKSASVSLSETSFAIEDDNHHHHHLFNTTSPTAGSELLKPEMMTVKRGDAASSIEVAKLKKDSVTDPKVLLGWQVILYDDGFAINGKGVITAMRKNMYRKTEYRISATNEKDHWIRLRRSEKKPGRQFQPLRKVLFL